MTPEGPPSERLSLEQSIEYERFHRALSKAAKELIEALNRGDDDDARKWGRSIQKTLDRMEELLKAP